MQALLAQGKKPGDVIVTTVDYYDDTDRFVREGWISAAMVQVPATMGAGVSTWPFVVTKDNADRIDLTTVRQAPADVMAGAYGRASFRHRGREDAKTRLRPGQLAIDRQRDALGRLGDLLLGRAPLEPKDDDNRSLLHCHRAGHVLPCTS